MKSLTLSLEVLSLSVENFSELECFIHIDFNGKVIVREFLFGLC